MWCGSRGSGKQAAAPPIRMLALIKAMEAGLWIGRKQSKQKEAERERGKEGRKESSFPGSGATTSTLTPPFRSRQELRPLRFLLYPTSS